jgi:hypothetical protein
MITILYPYRNREIQRIKNSLDTLLNQSNTEFKVIFVDYGSSFEISENVQQLIKEYKFVEYVYSYNIYQPWSRSKAINIGLRFVNTEYVFIADIDILFHKDFISILYALKQPKTNYYFQVGYLNNKESIPKKDFNDYKIISKSIREGKGLSFFKLESLLSVNGFDEFFHFWGAEDQDIHERLKIQGDVEIFYDQEILLLHQWHPTFESLKKDDLTLDPLLTDAFVLNKQKLKFNTDNNLIRVNDNRWGAILTKEAYNNLGSQNDLKEIINKKNNVDYFTNVVLSNSKNIKVRFVTDKYQKSLKYKIFKTLGINKKEYYSLKYINDVILLNVISHYNNCPYIFKVNSDFESIDFIIIK